MATRATYHHGELREALIDQAEVLIAESGPHAWSMREAARRVGVSPAAPYRHFETKDALIDAVVVRGYTKLEAAYRSAQRRATDPADRLRTTVLAYHRFGVDRPELFTLMFSSPRLHTTAEAEQSYGVFRDEIVKAQDRDHLPAGPPGALADALWSAVHGSTELVNRGVFSKRHGQRIASRTVDAMMAGLRDAQAGTTDSRR